MPFRFARCPFAVALACLVAGSALPLPAQPAADAPPAAYYPKADWASLRPDTMIMSSHAFNDRNRNGIYEVGERPIAKVAFQMKRPDGIHVLGWTNIDGFANFQLASDPKKGDFFAPGTYSFTAIVPPGWRATSDNVVQRRRIRALKGSPAGLVSDDLPVSVGLTPDLRIAGRLTGARASDARVLLTGPDGRRIEVRTGPEGTFEAEVSPGRWRVKAGGRERTVEVGFAPVRLSAFDPAAQPAPAAGTPFMLDFDELLSSRAILELPNGYAGLDWWSWVAVQNRMYNGEGFLNGTLSGDTAIYNSSGHPARISSRTPFDFVGGFFTVAWAEAEGEVLRIRAWRGNDLVHEDEVPLSALGPVWFDADYRGVTRIDFATDHFWQAVADDLQFRK